ncbi:MAG: antibiotic biosynthesis monooxygenase [Gemmatimonadetes bacterium]|nr:antibiotic biosynthesis monooxygenase [Gemmatimonadota bacterium]
MSFATPPAPPYLAVIFASQRTPGDDGYGATADRMVELAREQPGFLGVESARGPDGFGITVSYWESEAAVGAWKAVAEHRMAQHAGKDRWYQRYELKVATVVRGYGFERPAATTR